MNTVEILISAKALIIDPKDWCQGTLAKRKDGEHVSPYSYEACQWCAVGALARMTDVEGYAGAMRLLKRAAILMTKRRTPAMVNDGLGHKEVMAMYDKAIELAG